VLSEATYALGLRTSEALPGVSAHDRAESGGPSLVSGWPGRACRRRAGFLTHLYGCMHSPRTVGMFE